jgi:two-component system cell cycle sensor histidine kinase/response regulator CckA
MYQCRSASDFGRAVSGEFGRSFGECGPAGPEEAGLISRNSGLATASATLTAGTDGAITTALLRAADASTDAWGVFQAIRDEGGQLVDLRVLYANPTYWALTGMDADLAIGQGIGAFSPGIDWTAGVAGKLFEAMNSGTSYTDQCFPSRPQRGPHAGQDRLYEVEMTAGDDVMAASLRDVTAVIDAGIHQAAEARGSAALARFLAVAVDPAVSGPDLFGALASALAETIGDLCVIAKHEPDDMISVAAIAGGPGDLSAQIRESRLGRAIPFPDGLRQAFLDGSSVLYPRIPPPLRAAIAGSMRALGLPPAAVNGATSLVATAIRSEGRPIGRIHALRFGEAPAYTADDLATVETIAAAAALVIERRSVERALARSQERFETLFEQVPAPIVFVGADRSTRHNQAALELFGRDRAEMLELSFSAGAPWIPEDQVGLWADMRRMVAAGEAIRGQRMALLRPDGQRREVEGASIPIVSPDGSPGGVVTVMSDLTDRLHLEAQFRHAQKMEALGRLAGGVAHDFNNVLMAIGGYAAFVAGDLHDGRPPKVEHADQIVAATERAVELTARLTAFARREPVQVQTVDLADVIRGILPLIHQLVPESIQVTTHLGPVPLATLDRSEFEQVIVNLVVNAADAMPDGGKLTIELDEVDLEPDGSASHLGAISARHILVAVSDTGVGMDEATRLRIFEPFFTTKGVGEGTGLGLSMAFAAMERAGGRIWVYSEPGRGTTFKIYVPAIASATPSVLAEIGTWPALEGGSESILLVEDEPIVRDLIATTLRGLGYDVTEASRPSEAFSRADGRRFALLVSDVVMPEMTGDAVAAKLRAAQPDLRVLFMSGYTARALDFELGRGDRLLQKPVSGRDLARAVRDAIDSTADIRS